MKKNEREVREIERRIEELLEAEKSRLRDEESYFHKNTGARHAIQCLLRADALHPDYKVTIQEWVRKGGMAGLQINGQLIVPVE